VFRTSSSGIPRSIPALYVIAAIVMKSMYSRIIGLRPLASIRDRGGDVVEGGERHEHGGDRGAGAGELQDDLGDEGEGPSEPMISWVRS
jgi:hypothetical protein